MNRSHVPRRTAHMLILGTYTALSVGLMAETLLMSWELWALPLIVAGVAACWALHVRQAMTVRQRLWVYTACMMATFFFYGIHVTSAYDMGLLMMIVMLIYTLVGEVSLVTFCQAVYYVTLAYDLFVMAQSGTTWDSLLISRTILHVVLITLAAWLARFIIRQWEQLFKESDEQIAALNKSAQRMNAFLANISHELRTPVNAILGIANMLHGNEERPAVKRDLQTVIDAGNRMAEQVDDIMDYSELETGKLVVHAEPYTLSSLFNDLMEDLRPHTPIGLELVVDVDADTPAVMQSDARMLRKILFHLIGNGLKYTREGGVYVRVTSIRQDYGINLCIKVSDTGIGMAEEEIEQVANRFYQADSGKLVRSGGIGLGLPIVFGFVRALGGFIVVDSMPQQGTTVSVSIPQVVLDASPCMSVIDKERVNLGGYLNISKFAHPSVREHYDAMILNVVQGLGTPMHRVNSIFDLEKLNERIQLTHLFVGEEEYLSAPEYLERLARTMSVILVAHEDSALPECTHVLFLPKPLYGFPIASVLNAAAVGSIKDGKRIACPGVTALVVDDDPMNLHVACGILRKYDMSVSTAPSGADAIRACEQERFDIVFMDHMMPEMDGIEAMKHIRRLLEAQHRNVPIVALTANALSSARRQFLDEGFDGFISKPIEIPELERVLRSVLPKSSITYYSEGSVHHAAHAAFVDGAAGAPDAVGVEGAAGAGVSPEEPAGARDARSFILQGLREAGIDVELALGYCQHDIDFYLSLLLQFEADHAGKVEQLNRCRAQGDYRGYAIAVHALKGNALTIGARGLSEKAKDLEAAAKAGENAYVAKHHAALLAEYALVVDALRENLGSYRAFSEHDTVFEFEPEASDEVLEFAPAPAAPAADAPAADAPGATFDIISTPTGDSSLEGGE